MNISQTLKRCIGIALVTIGVFAANRQVAAQQMTVTAPEQMEVLTRGPVHEAFAETISFDAEPGIVVGKVPPEPIDEVAPDQRPEGDNVSWIPGYWSWDDERNDYLWVSGIWRALPPGRQWVPGYWGQSQQGVQWTSGYWADAAATEIDYLPEPPASIETGPNVAAPSEDATWLPGSWIWDQNRYGWRAGYWTKGNQDWDWVPDHYVWTPSGYVFVDGYYDYTVERRGVVFAPVYFNQGLTSQSGFSYSPSTVINSSVFGRNLFLRPSYGHYYFGDYYGSNYANSGYSPWFSYQTNRRGYDPFYANQCWRHRHDRDWEHRTQSDYRNFQDNESTRPPRSWSGQRDRYGDRDTTGRDARNRQNYSVATPFDEFTRQRDGQLRFQTVNPTERQQYGQRGQQYRQYLQQRQQLEANAAIAAGVDPTTAAGAARRRLSRSPFVAQSAEQLGTGYSPPQRHQVLKPDFQVQPQPRNRGQARGTRQGFAPGATGTGQMQNGFPGQRQNQDLNRRNRSGEATGQPQRQRGGGRGDRGGNPRTQGATMGQPQSGAAGVQQTGPATGGQQSAGTAAPPADSGGQTAPPTSAASPTE